MKKTTGPNKNIPIPLLAVFVLAVLVPSIALSLLALRAAERESIYAERRIEGTLLAEVDLAVAEIEKLLAEMSAETERIIQSAETQNDLDAAAVALPHTATEGYALFFAIRGDTIATVPPSGATAAQFEATFGDFLRGTGRLPVYDSIARVYRKEMRDARATKETAQAASAPHPAPAMSVAAEDTAMADAALEAEESSEAETLAEAPRRRNYEQKTAPYDPKSQKESPGVSRQIAQSSIASDPKVREEAFLQATKEGFEIAPRNVVQTGQGLRRDRAADERSGTVSRGANFAEVTSAARSGLLPRVADDGLEILYWTKTDDGTIKGAMLDMQTLRDRIAERLPDILSSMRVLTVLDESGEPIVEPQSGAGRFDWRRPFVSREISPQIPRWEVGVWLVDPGMIAGSARATKIAIWAAVAALGSVIAVGGFVVMRMLSMEMRTARMRTTFVANVSHELKTPLTSIRLFAEILMSGRQPDEEKRREYLKIMMSETDRLSHLVDNVLTFSKRGRSDLSMQPLDLGELAADTAAQLKPHLAKNGFSLDIAPASPMPVTGNRESLRQILMNLMANAEKYSDDRREISVACRVDDRYASVAVADRGIGIAPGLEEKIFQEFFRADDSLSAMRNGTGLGLAIARDIAKRHGGEIRFTRREGGGSIFTLTLPLQ